jgi:hypothetical protein
LRRLVRITEGRGARGAAVITAPAAETASISRLENMLPLLCKNDPGKEK